MDHPGVANRQLKDLHQRLLSERSDDPAWDSSRALVLAAIDTTNGSTDRVKDMAETQGLLVHFLIQEKERTPPPITTKELDEALLRVHDAACPWSEETVTGFDGRRRIDYDKLRAKMASNSGTGTVKIEQPEPADDSGWSFSLPGLPGLIKAHGKAATQGIGILLVLVYFGWRAYQDRQFEKRVETRLAGVSQDQAHNRVSATAQRTKTREDVKTLMDEEEADCGLPYEPSAN